MRFLRSRWTRLAAGLAVVVVLGLTTDLGMWGMRLIKMPASPEAVRIEVADVDRFLTTMDSLRAARSNADSLRILNQGYFAPGSPGLKAFVKSRIGDPNALLAQMTSHPKYYAHLSRSLANSAQAKEEIRAAFRQFKTLYPPARFSDVYLMVGRMNSGGTTSPGKILIGAEMYALDAEAPMDELSEWERMVLRDRQLLPTIVTHELIHLHQRHQWRSNVLRQALREGGADFIAERVTAKNINAHIHKWAAPREAAIWQEFQRGMLGTDYARWFGRATADRPADVGYWVGYRIAQAHYDAASDKGEAIKAILRVSDAEAFLKQSGYVGESRPR